jgi:hypothetical protein
MELEPFWKFDRREQSVSHSSFLSRLVFRYGYIYTYTYIEAFSLARTFVSFHDGFEILPTLI